MKWTSSFWIRGWSAGNAKNDQTINIKARNVSQWPKMSCELVNYGNNWLSRSSINKAVAIHFDLQGGTRIN